MGGAYCIENDFAAQKELAEKERENISKSPRRSGPALGGVMSEIMKCPICGEYPRELGKDSYSRKGIFCCGVEMWTKDNPSRWNQYAVAMELARVTACDCTESARTHAMAAYIKEFR